ncbi:uncharacterized protein LOC110255115 isoform X1 [Exaiptasia diaphana]|uniref:SAM domain-containing protein n=1 Tax=Exaiptasia diaphana TaxID=2652724 RepID=A0A913YCY9_EXADI|nr:uncharacterized protein LOC110255115 isoform X1 [Exaiptasia diaphana]
MDGCKLLKDLFDCLGMSHMCNRFLSLGYDQLQDVIYLKKDQIESLIVNPGESTKFLRRLYEERKVVSLWLQELGLRNYQEALFSCGLTSLKSFIGVTVQSVEISGITNCVHQRRLLRAVQILAESFISRDAVGIGEWSAHGQAKGGRLGHFLCLTAHVHKKINKDTPTSPTLIRPVRFLVDSGSDVVTLRPGIIRDLNLEPIGTAKQTGASGVIIDTCIYSACVKIGEKTVPVEVVSDAMDSLGTPVLRHFNHLIHNDKHFWLEKTCD